MQGGTATQPLWAKTRGYRHFDRPLQIGPTHALVSDPARVARHAFCPLLRWVKATRRRDGTDKERLIQYASHRDAAIYAWYTEELSKLYEAQLERSGLSECVLAYRQGRGTNVHAAHAAFSEIRARRDVTAICLDIEAFFDSIDHGRLRTAWSALLGGNRLPADHFAVFRSLTQYAYVERGELAAVLQLGSRVFRRRRKVRRGCRSSTARPSPEPLCTMDELRRRHRQMAQAGRPLICKHLWGQGIPQGTPISALLSNVFLLSFDVAVRTHIESMGGTYRRYCDDILLIVPCGQAQAAIALARAELTKLNLKVKDTKTEVVEFAAGMPIAGKPLQYLGLTYDGSHVRIRGSSLARYLARRTRAVAAAKAAGRKASSGQVPQAGVISRVTHLGRDNFFSYVRRVSGQTGDPASRGQVRASVERVLDALK